MEQKQGSIYRLLLIFGHTSMWLDRGKHCCILFFSISTVALVTRKKQTLAKTNGIRQHNSIDVLKQKYRNGPVI